MTLLSYHSKYVSQSATPATTTSSTLQDDSYATQTFTLYESHTVLAIYIASGNHGSTNYSTGLKCSININGDDHSVMCQSPGATNYAVRNTCFWIGTLGAGSHTIKGKFCSITNGQTVTVNNHTLLIYVFNGDEFYYNENSTTRTTATTSYAVLTGTSVSLTPSAACKSLVLSAITNDHGSTVPVSGYKQVLTVGGSTYTESEVNQSAFGANYAISEMTQFNGTHATSTAMVFRAMWAATVGTDTCTVNRSAFGVMFFDDSVFIERATSSTAVTTTSATFVNDGVGGASEVTTEPRELLVLASATTLYNTASSVYGGRYGMYMEGADRYFSTKSPYSATQGNCTYIGHGMSAPTAGTHTIYGRFCSNSAGSTERIGKRVVLGLYFPLPTLLTFRKKYVVQSGNTLQATTNTFVDDTYASQTFTLEGSQTVLAIYNANSDYGTTNSVYGFQNAISIDGVDHAVMQDSGYDANYPMRNSCVWVGTLLPGEHTIKGRLASNVESTTTNIINRTLLIYVFDGNAFYYVENTSTQVTLTNDTYVDDTVTALTFTPSAACKALVLYGVCNNHGTTESYLGKKVCVSVNSTDHTECQAMESAYHTTGYADSVATSYVEALAVAANTFVGRVATSYATYTTYVDRRFFAVLFFDDDRTFIDSDYTSADSDTTSSTSLVDDPDVSITRSIGGEVLALYTGCKRYLTNSAITGNVYGIMIDGVDVAQSRTSQAYSGSSNSCLVAYGQTLPNASHTVKGRYCAAHSGAVYITDRYMSLIWFELLEKSFSANNDVFLSKDFSVTNDLDVNSAFSSTNDLLLSTAFSATVDVLLSKAFSSLNDLDTSKAFSASSDLLVSKNFTVVNDIGVEESFSSTNDLLLSKVFSATVDVLLSKAFSNLSDVDINSAFSATNDLLLSKEFSSETDVCLSKYFASENSVFLSSLFSSLNDVLLKYAFSSINDISVESTYSSVNDLLLSDDFSSESDVFLNTLFEAISDIGVENSYSSANNVMLSTAFEAISDIAINAYFSSSNAILTNLLSVYFSSTNDICVSVGYSGDSDILESFENLFDSLNDIFIKSQVAASNDVSESVHKSSSNSVLISTTKVSSNDIIVLKQFLATNRIVLGSKIFTSTNRIFLFTEFDTSNDIQILKEFESTNSIIYIHFDPLYPLSVVVSRDRRLIVITDVTREVISYCAKKSVSVDSSGRTVSVDNPVRRTTIW